MSPAPQCQCQADTDWEGACWVIGSWSPSAQGMQAPGSIPAIKHWPHLPIKASSEIHTSFLTHEKMFPCFSPLGLCGSFLPLHLLIYPCLLEALPNGCRSRLGCLRGSCSLKHLLLLFLPSKTGLKVLILLVKYWGRC